MPTTEAGDSSNYPGLITIPSDGDGPSIKAADVNVAFEALADRTAHTKAELAALNTAHGTRLDHLEALAIGHFNNAGGTIQLLETDRYFVAQIGGSILKLPYAPYVGQTHFISTTISGTAAVRDSAGAVITAYNVGTGTQLPIPAIGIERTAWFIWNGLKWVTSLVA